MATSIKTTQMMHNDYNDVFTGIGCFKGTFSLQTKDDVKSYQAPPRHATYALKKTFKKELERLQGQEILAPLGVDETAEYCNSLVIVPGLNSTLYLCVDSIRLNQTLIRPVHRGLTIIDIY